MGSGLAMTAYSTAADLKLGHAATRLLVWMALNTADESEPPVYFGGAGHRAAGVGITNDSAVRRILRELKDSGAIKQRRSAHRGANAEYELNFRPLIAVRKAVQDSPPITEKGGESVNTKGVQDSPPYHRTRRARPQRRRSATPLASCGHPALPEIDRYCAIGCLLPVAS